MDRIIGGIELGGTKIVLAVANAHNPTNLIKRKEIRTVAPESNIQQIVDFFEENKPAAIGIGCFGPLELNKMSNKYGCILNTPKLKWKNVNLYELLKSRLQIPVVIDTDVNAAVYGEVMHGSARGCSNAIYITVGTGIGMGVYLNGVLHHGLTHPECGHMFINKLPKDKDFAGSCPFHSSCLEGLASGTAIEKRWGKSARELYSVEQVWNIEAKYLDQAICNVILMYSPERIILGGGVMHKPKLLEKVRDEVAVLLGSYLPFKSNDIVNAYLDNDAGVIGGISLATDIPSLYDSEYEIRR